MTRAAVLTSLLALSVPSLPMASELIMGVASVIDGDTIEIHGTRIRLHGVDAPESSQLCHHPTGKDWRCGQQAALTLADRIGRTLVRCEPRDHDRYGRVVAVCFQGSDDLGRWLVSNGWAVAFRRYGLDYIAEEARAQAAATNIWSGTFEMPWDWRAARRSPPS